MKIRVIAWIKNNGYEIKERELNTYLDNNGNQKESLSDYESRAYEIFGEDFFLVKQSKELESYTGLLNDYKKDLQILRLCGAREISIAEYEAMKFVLENKTKDWSQSPYSLSFYSSKNIDWNYKPEGSLRVSDHWNFGDNGEHCPTEESVNGWAVGVYKNGIYHIIKKF